MLYFVYITTYWLKNIHLRSSHESVRDILCMNNKIEQIFKILPWRQTS